MKTQNFIVAALGLFIQLSCGKNDKSKYGYEGIYDCFIYHHYLAPDTLIIDTAYQDQLKIRIEDDNAVITKLVSFQDQTISADDLSTGYAEWINPNGTGGLSHIRLVGDSIYARIYNHHKFGYIEYKDYSGLKE